jgi:hypothetical protein
VCPFCCDDSRKGTPLARPGSLPLASGRGGTRSEGLDIVTATAPGQPERHGKWRYRDERGPGQQHSNPSGREPVIVSGARTAIGRLLGTLAGFSGAELGGIVIGAALERAGLYEMQRRGGGLGAAGLCGGGGRGEALIIGVPAAAV